MANNVFANYTFKGEEAEVKALKNLTAKAGKTDYYKTPKSYGKDWLGGILCEAGLSKEAEKDIPCRGSVAGYSALEYTDDGEVKFDITAVTAWKAMPAMWKAIIDKLGLKTVKIAYITDGDEGDGACKYDPINVYPEEYMWISRLEMTPLSAVMNRMFLKYLKLISSPKKHFAITLLFF